MKPRYTTDKYLRALSMRLLQGQAIKEEAVRSIMAAALSVKQLENHLTSTRAKHTFTEAEQHQLSLAQETKEKLIDIAAKFDVSVLDNILRPKTK
jgi:hypothetical protein